MTPALTNPEDHDAAREQAWQARLALRFAREGAVSRLVGNAHYGPLRVQKSLHPEGDAVCHAIVVHPPGGVVGGDQLAIKVDVGHGAHALLTTPGAGKWYRANGRTSRQELRLHVGADAALEWLPQETIFYDRAEVALEQEISLAAGATYLGCDILCMGRRASGESFARGRIRQRTSIRRGGRLIWWEQGALQGGQLDSPFALHGHSVCATLIAAGTLIPAALVEQVRAEAQEQGWPAFGVSQTKEVFTARHLGDDSEAARRIMLAVWRRLRPHLLGREAVTPRIWQT